MRSLDNGRLPAGTVRLLRSAAQYVVRHEKPAGAKLPLRTEVAYYVGLLIPKILPLATDADSLAAYVKAGKPDCDDLETAVIEALVASDLGPPSDPL